jgi:hypothetical protein
VPQFVSACPSPEAAFRPQWGLYRFSTHLICRHDWFSCGGFGVSVSYLEPHLRGCYSLPSVYTYAVAWAAFGVLSLRVSPTRLPKLPSGMLVHCDLLLRGCLGCLRSDRVPYVVALSCLQGRTVLYAVVFRLPSRIGAVQSSLDCPLGWTAQFMSPTRLPELPSVNEL